jgi:hypothetical protein
MQEMPAPRLTLFGSRFEQLLTFAPGDTDLLLRQAGAYDVVVVPGTTGTVFRQAAGSFTSMVGKPYVVDPRSWLFQLTPEQRGGPEPKYTKLAREHGASIAAIMAGRSLTTRDLADHQLLSELVTAMLEFQRTLETAANRKSIDKWRSILGRPVLQDNRLRPFALVPPYFACRTATPSSTSDAHLWFEANVKIADMAAEWKSGDLLCPVISISKAMLVREQSRIISAYCNPAYDGFFLLVDDLDEIHEVPAVLASLRDLVTALSTTHRKPVMNLAGGYFSLLLYHAGLAGVCHGPGYGESRPISGSRAVPRRRTRSGAPPPRYYVAAVHRFYTRPVASLVLASLGQSFWCRCAECSDAWAATQFNLAQLSGRGLQGHFLRSRRGEVETIMQFTLDELLDQLESAERRATELIDPILGRQQPVAHLGRWTRALRRELGT